MRCLDFLKNPYKSTAEKRKANKPPLRVSKLLSVLYAALFGFLHNMPRERAKMKGKDLLEQNNTQMLYSENLFLASYTICFTNSMCAILST